MIPKTIIQLDIPDEGLKLNGWSLTPLVVPTLVITCFNER